MVVYGGGLVRWRAYDLANMRFDLVGRDSAVFYEELLRLGGEGWGVFEVAVRSFYDGFEVLRNCFDCVFCHVCVMQNF